MRCVSCDIEVNGAKYAYLNGQVFCCEGCAHGGPCHCSYEGFEAAASGRDDPLSLTQLLDAYADEPPDRRNGRRNGS